MKHSLQTIVDNFIGDLGVVPIVSTEIEFFLIGDKARELASYDLDALFSSVIKSLHSLDIKTSEIEKEVGNGQFEINLLHSKDVCQIAEQTLSLRKIISDKAKLYDLAASFLAKPSKDSDVGNGLHIHISLEDVKGNNVFADADNSMLNFAIGGLLEYMLSSIFLLAKNKDNYARFAPHINLDTEQRRLRCSTTNAPMNVSWGGNNRTTAIRIPDCATDIRQKHIEYRVPSASSDPYMALAIILLSIKYGIENKIVPLLPKIYGNAFDEQYELPKFPRNLKEAEDVFSDSRLEEMLQFYKII
jgi:glutamine synthetase